MAVLKWLQAAGCPLDELVCRAAVRGAHLAVLQWLERPWGSLTCVRARELMEERWLNEYEDDPLFEVEEACDYYDIDRAAKTPKAIEAVMEWLRANGCPEGEGNGSSEGNESSDGDELTDDDESTDVDE
jgi:hypothetical protein